MRIHRVVVRGQFDNLEDTTRATLIDNAAEHHFLRSAFTSDGTFTYDNQLIAFNLRYEVRDVTDEVSQDEIGDAAIERTTRWLTAHAIGHKRLRSTVTDMSTIWN